MCLLPDRVSQTTGSRTLGRTRPLGSSRSTVSGQDVEPIVDASVFLSEKMTTSATPPGSDTSQIG